MGKVQLIDLAWWKHHALGYEDLSHVLAPTVCFAFEPARDLYPFEYFVPAPVAGQRSPVKVNIAY